MPETRGEGVIFCRGKADQAGGRRPKLKDSKKTDDPGKEAIRCRNCGGIVTSFDAKTSVDGGHTHTFFNPAGIVFELGCFSSAPGCSPLGEATSEFTWFAGCTWRFSVCRGCGAHLGWLYEGRGKNFFGLILANLL